MLREFNASAQPGDVCVLNPEPVPDQLLHSDLPVKAVPSGWRTAGLEQRPGPFEGRQQQIWIEPHHVDGGSPVHHHLQPLVDRGVVPAAWIAAQQRLGGVVGRHGRLVLGVAHLQPPQSGVQVGSLERVDRSAELECRAEGGRGRVELADAPEHIGKLGVQPDGVGRHGLVLPGHRQGGVERGDRLVVGERVGRMVAGQLEVVHGPLGVLGGRVIVPEDRGNLGQAFPRCRFDRRRGAGV
jgi:hypothetical protein